MGYLPYEEPGIVTLLSLSSFLIVLNAIHLIFDKLLYCGLIGQILIGIVWGIPVGGTSWLNEGTQHAIQQLGYLGLILLVFEGGLSTDLVQFRKTILVSAGVATVGLLLPIALSFIMLAIPFDGGVYPSPLAAFSAGAALCSTSLGTIFAILSSAGLRKTRTGTILVGAAMMDDVVGLVMVNIVATLGNGDTSGWLIARPIVGSFGMLLVTLVVAPLVLKPVWLMMVGLYRGTSRSAERENGKTELKMASLLHKVPHISFVMSTLVLITFVTIAGFIHASVLFAAFIAGGIVTYLWTAASTSSENVVETGPALMYEGYFLPVTQCVLAPFFFASIGFSIPITSMFRGSIVWKGIVYAILMAFAKVAVSGVIYFDWFIRRHFSNHAQQSSQLPDEADTNGAPHRQALIVACAMVARGEIGYLIASLSQSSGTLELQARGARGDKVQNEDIFLVIIWAVTLCTIGGPVAVGTLVRKMKAAI